MCAGPVWISHWPLLAAYLASLILAFALSVRPMYPAGTPVPAVPTSGSCSMPGVLAMAVALSADALEFPLLHATASTAIVAIIQFVRIGSSLATGLSLGAGRI